MRSLLLTVLMAGMALNTACAPRSGHVPYAQSTHTESTESIIGGQDVGDRDPIRKSIVIVYSLATGGICTGSIYKKNLIITAAHCVTDPNTELPQDPQQLLVIFGNEMMADDVVANHVTGVAVSPLWESRNRKPVDTGDIALVRIDGPLPTGFRPAKLLTSQDLLKNGETVTLAGYGMSDAVAREGSGVLRKTDVSIEKVDFAKTEVLLDQTQGTGACHGDSGGPAYLKVDGEYLLWGVTSRGVSDPEDHCKGYSAYTDILAYSKWLESAAKTLSLLPQGSSHGGLFPTEAN